MPECIDLNLLINLDTLVETRDMSPLDGLADADLAYLIDKQCTAIFDAVEQGYTPMIKLFQRHSKDWAWNIKNLFSVFGRPDLAQLVYDVCPEAHQPRALLRVHNYGYDNLRTPDEARAFVQRNMRPEWWALDKGPGQYGDVPVTTIRIRSK